MPRYKTIRLFLVTAITIVLLTVLVAPISPQGRGQGANAAPAGPWMDKNLSPDQRADLVIAKMTLDQKIQARPRWHRWIRAAAADSAA